MARRLVQLGQRVYALLCGDGLKANLFNLLYLPAYYLRRDIQADSPLLRGRWPPNWGLGRR
jgi:hypothetical protein